ncbi:flagellar basal-body MS-ring/collar protein FliF [Caulobacter sp. KR2-114]|uniref:flagellar basal-body MS-ring/collar protein FliF n=1 Tax=Caulobacter sp. KR2-114 TaxID=3400912 RepID=UPI003BFE48FB
MLGIGAGAAALIAAILLNVGGQPMGLLYSNLDLREAGTITQALEQAGIKYQVKGDGSTIMVERDKVASARLLLAGKGLPTAGSVGYEIFDNQSALGQTDFVQQLNMKRATEGELARTIRSLDGVTEARVHLVMPRRQLFEDEAEQPTAAVTIGVGAREPSADQVRSVQNLVAGAVPNMKPDRVTVIDQHGKTLSGGSDAGSASQVAQTEKAAIEERIRKTVKDMVEGVVGPGHARVQVTADVDLNQVTTQEKKFDPDGQVVRSEQTNEQNSKENNANSGAVTSATANTPGTTPGQGTENGNSSGQTESTTNYEISETTRTEVQSPGQVKRLSVAVAVDGVTAPGAKGKPGAYSARTPEEMKHLDELVRAAIGYSADRGDVVSVVNVKFPHDDDPDGVSASNPLMGFDKNDIMRAVELGILGLVALVILFFVVRPLVRGATTGGGLPALAGPGGQVTHLVATADGVSGQIAGGGGQLALAAPDIDQKIDIAKIEGQVKASSVKRVAEFVDKHPDESVSILRSWLHESA